jgi:hypothetical protein
VNADRNPNPSTAEQLRLDEELAARFEHTLAGERLGVPLPVIVRRARRHRRRLSWQRHGQLQLAAALVLVAVVVAAGLNGLTEEPKRLARPPASTVPPPPAPTLSSGPSGPSKSAWPPLLPSKPPGSVVLSFFSRWGAQNWTAFPGTILSRGMNFKQGNTYARIQKDPSSQPATDPSSGAAVVGIKARVLAKAAPNQQVWATVRLRATRPGFTVVVRLSEWEGHRLVDSGERGEGRLTLPDTGVHQVGAGYYVAASGRSVYLEILALDLGADGALFVDPPPRVTST